MIYGFCVKPTAAFGGGDPFWIISSQGNESDSDAARDLLKRQSADKGERFRLLDDDGHVYFHGVAHMMDRGVDMAFFDQVEEIVFMPLDWAMGRHGATELHIKDKKGAWVRL